MVEVRAISVHLRVSCLLCGSRDARASQVFAAAGFSVSMMRSKVKQCTGLWILAGVHGAGGGGCGWTKSPRAGMMRHAPRPSASTRHIGRLLFVRATQDMRVGAVQAMAARTAWVTGSARTNLARWRPLRR